jgi:hypothetical protein
MPLRIIFLPLWSSAEQWCGAADRRGNEPTLKRLVRVGYLPLRLGAAGSQYAPQTALLDQRVRTRQLKASTMGRNFIFVSASSRAGSEPSTMPPPA